jgi:hypothetical protein
VLKVKIILFLSNKNNFSRIPQKNIIFIAISTVKTLIYHDDGYLFAKILRRKVSKTAKVVAPMRSITPATKYMLTPCNGRYLPAGR